MECIVLAGGLGTRLQSVVEDVPKCMAPVNGQPFLHYVFDYLEQQQCNRVILSLGYKHNHVLHWLESQQRSFHVDYVIEHEPMGTGGGIQLALSKTTGNDIVILNGDTMFRADLSALVKFHKDCAAETTLALKPMKQFDRYGVVDVDNRNCIIAFEEKKHYEKGLINGGIYVVDKTALASKKLPVKHSFEKDYFEAFVQERKMFGFVTDAYFIDIGIPSDYLQAQEDFKNMK